MSDFEVPQVVDVHAPRRGVAIDLEGRLQQLEHLLATAKTVPLSSSIMLNRAEVDGLIADIRAAIPEELRQARWVIKEREEVLASARAEHDRILEEARSERARLISRTEVVEAANREAERMLDDARERARQLGLKADDYVDDKLADFEALLEQTLQSVERGRDRLRSRPATGDMVDDLADQEVDWAHE